MLDLVDLIENSDTNAAADIAAVSWLLATMAVSLAETKRWELGRVLDILCSKLREGAVEISMNEDRPRERETRR